MQTNLSDLELHRMHYIVYHLLESHCEIFNLPFIIKEEKIEVFFHIVYR